MMAGRRGAVIVLVGVAAVVMLIAVLVGPTDGRRSGPPLDPRSTIDSGTRAAVILLERQGRDVGVGAVSRSAGTHLVFVDDMSDRDRAALLALVDGGGSVLVADPDSPLVESVVASGTVSTDVTCGIEPIASVADLSVGLVPGLDAGDASCFPVRDGWFVTVSAHGAGRVVAVASARPFVNGRLDDAHHAALLVGLADLTEGPIRIVHAAPGSGDKTLAELVGEPVWAALALGLLAVVSHGLHRSRRHGRPVVEADPVQIEGSELVLARSRLYAGAGAGHHVIEQMASDLRAELESRWGFAPSADTETIVERLQLHPRDAEHLRGALATDPPNDDADLTARIAHGVHARRIILGTEHHITAAATRRTRSGRNDTT